MKEPMNKKWEIVSSRLAGDSVLDDKAFESWLASDVENRALWVEVQSLWNKSYDAGLIHAVDIDQGWEAVHMGMHKRKPSLRLKSYFGVVAATFLLLVGLSVGFFLLRKDTVVQWNQLKVLNQPVSSLVLADGSVVDVNRGSDFSYPVSFHGDVRLVRLQGEAFFDVRKGLDKPFVIDVGQFSVHVTGTAFNVKNSDGSFEVVVVEGSVVVRNHNKGDDVVNVMGGEFARFDQSQERLVRGSNQNRNFLAWKTRRLEFRNSTLEDVCRALQSVYGIQVELDAQLDGSKPLLTAAFSHDDLDNVINVIELTLDVDFVARGDGHYYLSPSR